MSKNVKRLLDQFRPNHYILQIHPDKKTMSFQGTVIIAGHKLGRPSQRLVFHQNGLKITRAKVTLHDKKGDREVEIDRINHHNSYDEVRLHATEMLYPGQYTVTMEFKGEITRPMNGIYPCFFEENGTEQILIATQFESHHAREAFPCIDEPAAKATFDLTITTPEGETVLSNTPAKEQQTKNGLTTTTFETTPHMSTYLLAFVFGKLAHKEAKTKNGTIVRTYATPDKVEQTDFALDTAVRCLEFYEDYFNIKYPLEKCDLIALPDFASGAMENWGCITFRETTMLVDPVNTSLHAKQYVAMVIAHELAHQWFGNLVTMRWWTDLWLNEGFASWIEYLAVDHLYPDWDMWMQFNVDEQQAALKLDALEHTHPIEVPVRHPDEIRTIFDAISYSKGASVIHMLHEYLGPEVFRDGLRYYLNKHEYSNTDTVDLWAALEEVSQKPVKDFMHAWTSQGGFPIVTANAEGSDVELKQERFYLNPKARNESPVSPLWPVPLLSEPLSSEILDKPSGTFTTNDPEHTKLNIGHSGFYRTIYNATHRERLGELIRRGKLGPIDRMGVLSDTFEAAKAGYTDTTEALSLLQYYDQEDNSVVWDIISSNLASIRAAMDDDELRDQMKPYMRRLVEKQLARLGWQKAKNEPHLDSLLRPTILGMASFAEEPAVVEKSLELFNDMNKPEDIEPDIRGVVYGTAVRHGGEAEFDKLLKMHDETTSSEERNTIVSALTGFKQPELIKRALEIVTTDKVRLQDVSFWVAYSFLNRHAKHDTWKWMKQNWQWLSENLSSDLSFYRYPIYAGRAFSDEKFLTEYKEFFFSVTSPALDRSIKQGIEMIEWQSDWKARDFKKIKSFFTAK